MISKEKNSPGPTSWAAWTRAALRTFGVAVSPSSDIFRLAFSTMTIEASTMAPIAMAIPPSDMILAVTPCPDMIRKAPSTPSGIVMMATNAARK